MMFLYKLRCSSHYVNDGWPAEGGMDYDSYATYKRNLPGILR